MRTLAGISRQKRHRARVPSLALAEPSTKRSSIMEKNATGVEAGEFATMLLRSAPESRSDISCKTVAQDSNLPA